MLEALCEQYLERRALRTCRSRARRALEKFLAFQNACGLAWNEVDGELLRAYAGTPGYAQDEATGLRHWLRYLLRRGVLGQAWNEEVVRPRQRQSLRRLVPRHEEMVQLLGWPCLDEPQGLWDRAVFEVVYGSGMRAGELVATDLEDLDLARGTLHLRRTKNGWERVVPLTEMALRFVRRYLAEVRPLWKSALSGSALWLDPNGRRCDRHLPTIRLQAYPQQQLFGKVYTLHCLRHACATRLLQNGAALRLVQVLLGHRVLRSTQVYTQVTPMDVLAMHRRFHPRELL